MMLASCQSQRGWACLQIKKNSMMQHSGGQRPAEGTGFCSQQVHYTATVKSIICLHQSILERSQATSSMLQCRQLLCNCKV